MPTRAPRSKTAPSTPRLSEFARCFTFPAGIDRTVWPRVEAKGTELGLGFDWWQRQLGMVCLGYGKDGKYVATVGGVGMSIPRQVGKTYFVLALLVIMCILFPGLQVVWTAHHLRTSTKTFTALRGICRRKKVRPHIRAMRSANGEQQVEFANGSMIMFGARSRGFGRGFDEIDVEVFDEAQILDTKSLEDMVAATNQARHIHGALLFFMGTPPRPADPSEAFKGRRAKARAGKALNAIWLEIGADPDSHPDDRAQWPFMNPSYPTRTPAESMDRLRENLSDEDSWNREGRGIWDEDDAGGFFTAGRWAAGFDPKAKSSIVGDVALGLAVSIDRKRAAIGSAGLNKAGQVHFEPVWFGSPAASVAEAARLVEAHKAVALAIDGTGPGADLVPTLELLIRSPILRVMKADDVKVASSEVFDLVEAFGHAHLDDHDLNAAVRAAVQKPVGDRFVIARRKSTSDTSALEAVALASWALTRSKTYNVLDSVL